MLSEHQYMLCYVCYLATLQLVCLGLNVREGIVLLT